MFGGSGGGRLHFFGMSNGAGGLNNTNVLDLHDLGRLVQAALYEPDLAWQGCAWNVSCQTNGPRSGG